MTGRQPRATGVAIDLDAAERTTAVSWAADRLRDAFARQRVPTRLARTGDAPGPTVTVARGRQNVVADRVARAGTSIPQGDEAFVIAPDVDDDDSTLVWGGGERGVVYGLLELADRLDHASGPLSALPRSAIMGEPANEIRSVARLFCSEIEDLGWFRDEGFWDRYLSMLVTQRFNRFSLTLGLGYNYHRRITDAYLYFAYPFLLRVPGFDVRVPLLTEEECDRNLAMLRHISDACQARGLDFQLGLWTHAYDWIDSPDAHHTIEGLTPDRHAAYCRDAVALLLAECPSIGGVTFRIHGESGVPERSWDFWRVVFTGVAGCGRSVGLDLHAKGLDARTLQDALDTGMHVTVSPKFWAEHMGLPYHQAAIRELERQVREDPSARSEWHRYMAVSEGSRPFTRYGYGDFLREDRPYDVVFRLWAGTQRLLLWGDPEIAAGYGRAASLAGSAGARVVRAAHVQRQRRHRPLGRSRRLCGPIAGAGGRLGEVRIHLSDCSAASRTTLRHRLSNGGVRSPRPFGSSAPAAEGALASASKILPLVTVAHHPSASNNYYWPEIYTDMPIVWSRRETRPHPYLDTPHSTSLRHREPAGSGGLL